MTNHIDDLLDDDFFSIKEYCIKHNLIKLDDYNGVSLVETPESKIGEGAIVMNAIPLLLEDEVQIMLASYINAFRKHHLYDFDKLQFSLTKGKLDSKDVWNIWLSWRDGSTYYVNDQYNGIKWYLIRNTVEFLVDHMAPSNISWLASQVWR